MSGNDHLTVIGVFNDQATAERAIRELREAGFSQDDIGFAMREADPPAGARDAGVGSKAGEGAVSGIVTGGVVGGVAAAAVSLLIPGVGPVIGGGILATVLGGAAAGAAAGGLVGTFIGMGVPEEEARYYNNEFEAGRALVSVRADRRYKEAADIIERYAAPSREEMDRSRDFAANPMSAAIEESAVAAGSTAAGTVPEANLPRPFQEGPETEEMPGLRDTSFYDSAHPHPSVLATQQYGTMPRATAQQPVTAAEDGATVESSTDAGGLHTEPKVTVADPATMSTMDAPPRETRISPGTESAPSSQGQTTEPAMTGPSGQWPVSADDPQAGKLVEGEEEVTDSGHRMFITPSGTARSSDAAEGTSPYVDPERDLEQVGATSALSTQVASASWADSLAGYRQKWEASGGTRSGRWEDVAPAYHYGHEAATDPRYHGRDWSSVEQELESGAPEWMSRHGYRSDDGWQAMRPHARDAWEQARTSSGNHL